MLILLTAAALAAAPAAAPAAPMDSHAMHGMQAGSADMHGPACKECGSDHAGMKHDGMKDGGCGCCKQMHDKGQGQKPAGAAGA